MDQVSRERRRCETKSSSLGSLHCPCAAEPALLGEAAMRRKDQRGRWGEVPKSGTGHPPVLTS